MDSGAPEMFLMVLSLTAPESGGGGLCLLFKSALEYYI